MKNLTDIKNIFLSAADFGYIKTRWKWYLAVTGLMIVFISAVYTNYLVSKLRQEESERVELFKNSLQLMMDCTNDEFNNLPQNVKDFLANINNSNSSIPLILTDSYYRIMDVKNFSKFPNDSLKTAADTAYITNRLNYIISSGAKPFLIKDLVSSIYQRIYYDDSKILTLLKYYPLFQFFLISLFIGFGYLGFSSSRKSEQNRVWVGMAKETAHQLGTPIAAILGWIEFLKANHEDNPETLSIVEELNNDVSRLSLVADRFSKIGSDPELSKKNLYEELDVCKDYMQKRSPRRVAFNFPSKEQNALLFVNINAHLFDWVIENILRNALDAMETGEGAISAIVYTEKNWVCMDITDTGKGIPNDKWATVFQPGFTTKKRGWGLGLSLAKRIIENYHKGKIFVKDSVIGKGTTFTIKLPVLK